MKQIILLFFGMAVLLSGQINQPWKTKLKDLTPFERYVIEKKGTEQAFSGKYVNRSEKGVYRCKVCNTALYRSNDKFKSHCGWPSFDEAIPGAVREVPDKDGVRTEIVCAKCGAHLGHVFRGEGLTKKNVRYCVNSVSLNFDNSKKEVDDKLARAYFAGGCFWGVEYYMEKIKGVREVTSGFMGGKVKNPSYEQVSYTQTGHIETVEVLYDPSQVSYETLAKTFFEIHDPTQKGGQGPDMGSQYISAIFVSNAKERRTIEKLIGILKKKGYRIVTKIFEKSPFYSAEAYHQDYYERKGTKPYCHRRVKRFD